jgi:hypothetical protein
VIAGISEVDAEVLDLRAVGHRKVGTHPDQQLVQCEPLRPERDELAHLETGEIVHLRDLAERSERVLRPEDRAQVAKLVWNLRAKTRIPWSELNLGSSGGGIHVRRPMTANRVHTGRARRT